MPKAKFSPYIGAGINWNLFFNQEKSTDITAVNYTNSVGPAFQAGLDMRVDDHWSLNIDIKKVFVQTDVTGTARSTPRAWTSIPGSSVSASATASRALTAAPKPWHKPALAAIWAWCKFRHGVCPRAAKGASARSLKFVQNFLNILILHDN